MTSSQRTPKEDLLVGGLDDWADAGWALQSARLSGATDPVALRDLTLSLIAEVLREGLMVPGDIVGGDHVPWHGSAQETAERITREWVLGQGHYSRCIIHGTTVAGLPALGGVSSTATAYT